MAWVCNDENVPEYQVIHKHLTRLVLLQLKAPLFTRLSNTCGQSAQTLYGSKAQNGLILFLPVDGLTKQCSTKHNHVMEMWQILH